jgi:hypothetical protein
MTNDQASISKETTDFTKKFGHGILNGKLKEYIAG